MPFLVSRSRTTSPSLARSSTRRLGFAAAILLLSPLSASADAIDGDWCFATQNLHIQGPRIRTPSGLEMTGDYSRHGFQYTVPTNEPGAGTAISMQLFSEELMQLTRAGGAPEMWRRCKPVS